MKIRKVEIGSLRLSRSLELSCHPGLTDEFHLLPVDLEGEYEVRIIRDDAYGFCQTKITILHRSATSWVADRERVVTGICSQSHGVMALAANPALKKMSDYFDQAIDPNEYIWNSFTNADEVIELTIPEPENEPHRYALIGCEDWLSAVPLTVGHTIVGYEIVDSLDHRGNPKQLSTTNANKSVLTTPEAAPPTS